MHSDTRTLAVLELLHDDGLHAADVVVEILNLAVEERFGLINGLQRVMSVRWCR